MSFETAQAQHDRQEPPAGNETPCGRCGERYEDHWFGTLNGTLFVLCEALDMREFDQFEEMSEEEGREEARLRAAGL